MQSHSDTFEAGHAFPSALNRALHVPAGGIIRASVNGRVTVTLKAQLPGGRTSWAMTGPTAGEEILDVVLHRANVALRMWRPGLGELTITDESCLRALLTPGFSRRQSGTAIAWGDRYDRTGAEWSVAVLRDSGSDFWIASDDTYTDGTSEADLLEAVAVRQGEASPVSWAVLPFRAGP